jgi:hypothetical protein
MVDYFYLTDFRLKENHFLSDKNEILPEESHFRLQ